MNEKLRELKIESNKMTIEDKCSLLYPQFEKIKYQFLKYFDDSNDIINFDKFMPSIQNETKYITVYIIKNIFYGNNYNWDEGDTIDWILKCFFKIKTKQGIKKGYIIQLYYTDNFAKYFCNSCKNTLSNMINDRLKHINRNKRYCKDIISLEDDNVKELQDLKNYINDIDEVDVYIKFKRTLKKTEKEIFELALFLIYKNKSNINQEDLAKYLELNKSTISKNINNIKLKWNDYKKNNNIK